MSCDAVPVKFKFGGTCGSRSWVTCQLDQYQKSESDTPRPDDENFSNGKANRAEFSTLASIEPKKYSL